MEADEISGLGQIIAVLDRFLERTTEGEAPLDYEKAVRTLVVFPPPKLPEEKSSSEPVVELVPEENPWSLGFPEFASYEIAIFRSLHDLDALLQASRWVSRHRPNIDPKGNTIDLTTPNGWCRFRAWPNEILHGLIALRECTDHLIREWQLDWEVRHVREGEDGPLLREVKSFQKVNVAVPLIVSPAIRSRLIRAREKFANLTLKSLAKPVEDDPEKPDHKGPRLPTITVNIEKCLVCLDGVPFGVKTEAQAHFVDQLAKANGEWLSGPQMQRLCPALPHRKNLSRDCREKLPKELFEVIESGGSKGYRIKKI